MFCYLHINNSVCFRRIIRHRMVGLEETPRVTKFQPPCHRQGHQPPVMRAASKVMPPFLLRWAIRSEADVGGMAVEAEPSHQHPVTRRCHVADGSRGAVWQNGIWCGGAYEAKVCHWIPPSGKKVALIDIHQHLLNVSGDQTVDVSRVSQWAVCFSSGGSGSPSLVQMVMIMAGRLLFITGKNA